uniref:hypothetical protein n=1 Tax=Phocaeicola vulgatus TaxID=821 RepID=UPI00402A50DB
ERFTRNEEVPGSSPGFGSENQRFIDKIVADFFVYRHREKGVSTPSLTHSLTHVQPATSV